MTLYFNGVHNNYYSQDCSLHITFPFNEDNKEHLYITSSPSIFGRRFSSGTSTSSMTIWPVVEALKENFPSILGAESPFIPF